MGLLVASRPPLHALIRLRPTHRFRTKIQIPSAIHKTVQAVTMIMGIGWGALQNMIVEAK